MTSISLQMREPHESKRLTGIHGHDIHMHLPSTSTSLRPERGLCPCPCPPEAAQAHHALGQRRPSTASAPSAGKSSPAPAPAPAPAPVPAESRARTTVEAAWEREPLIIVARLRSLVLPAECANRPLSRAWGEPSFSALRREDVRVRVRSSMWPLDDPDVDEDGVDAEKPRSERVRGRAVAYALGRVKIWPSRTKCCGDQTRTLWRSSWAYWRWR
jgi:hypothetical protein